MSLTLFEYAPTRSARVRWTLLELALPFESHEGLDLFRGEELRKVHPLNKLPALIDNGRPLFKSAAICTWLADSHPEKNFVATAGTWERALHDQWVAFTLSEFEAHEWSTARNTFVYDEEKRIPEIIAQNNRETIRSLHVLDAHLAGEAFFVGNRFSVTDIIVGYAINNARRAGLTDGLANLRAFNDRLLAMPFCPFNPE